MTRARFRLVATLSAALLSSTALAKPAARPPARALAEAKLVFKQATADYDAGRYEEARRGFERAHELSRNPVLYFNLAACDEKLGQARVAVAHLRAYLAEVPNADDVVQVRERIGALEERARHEDERRVDEERRAEDEARRRKAEEERARAAAAAAPVAERPVEPPPAAPVETRSVGRQYLGGFVGLGLTAAFGAVAAGLGGSAVAKYDELDRSCGGACPEDRVSPVRTQAIVADVFIGLTGAAAVATIVLFAVEAKQGHKRDRVAMGPAGLGVRF